MAVLDSLDDWKAGFEFETTETSTQVQQRQESKDPEDMEAFLACFLEAFERLDPADMTMH